MEGINVTFDPPPNGTLLVISGKTTDDAFSTKLSSGRDFLFSKIIYGKPYDFLLYTIDQLKTESIPVMFKNISGN